MILLKISLNIFLEKNRGNAMENVGFSEKNVPALKKQEKFQPVVEKEKRILRIKDERKGLVLSRGFKKYERIERKEEKWHRYKRYSV